MENYIVRVYRRDDQNPDDVIGIVVRVESDDTQTFHTLSELCEILSSRPADACSTEAHTSREQFAPITSITKKSSKSMRSGEHVVEQIVESTAK